jgi:hypothetical protein
MRKICSRPAQIRLSRAQYCLQQKKYCWLNRDPLVSNEVWDRIATLFAQTSFSSSWSFQT